MNCVAHDGAGDAIQRLTDASGCPTDETILPALSPVLSRDQLRSLKAPPKDGASVVSENHLEQGAELNSTGDEKQARLTETPFQLWFASSLLLRLFL